MFLAVLALLVAAISPWAIFKMGNSIAGESPVLFDNLVVRIPVTVNFEKQRFDLPDLIESTQIQIDREIKHLTSGLLQVNLVDNLSGLGDRGDYNLDLVLDRDNSLGVSSTSLQAAVFYSTESIYSNDLPFLMTQTILHHFLFAEIELLNRPETASFPEKLAVQIGFGNGISNETRSQVVGVIEEVAEQVRPFSAIELEMTTSSELLKEEEKEEKEEKEVVINFPDKFTKRIKSEDNVAHKIQTALETQLKLPDRPQNNLRIRVLAAMRRQARLNLKRLTEKAQIPNTTTSTQTRDIRLLVGRFNEGQISDLPSLLNETNYLLQEISNGERRVEK
ncbi:uncharacterized protein LODBEIA_P18240 [Lodderomyces beijingensis]|uniref:Uncharacterized protein n=1 Tax=Lodderomyces beijingensis TaxID=1775926 RepID=A0ABP0ZHG7_9ASCO